jgi:hypothetical protein
MALQYGMNITASDMRSLLEKNDKQQSGIRTWRRLFGNASLGYNAQSDALTTDYSDAIAQAYRANFAQNNAIMNAGLGTGMTREMLAQSRNDLHTAYETYIRNYGSDMTKASENYGEEVGAIDAALTERATNFANLYNSAYKYLAEELYGSTLTLPGTAENGATPIYEGKGKKSKLVGYENVTLDYFDENDLGWLKNDAGELLSWNELSHSLMNPDGSLTAKGVKFFDQMFNTLPENYMSTNDEGETWRTRGFDEWLSATDNELRNWWVSQDEFNYNFAGTNKGTANVLTSRESTDTKYGKYEYLMSNKMTTPEIVTTLKELDAFSNDNEDAEIFQNYWAAEEKVKSTNWYKTDGRYTNASEYETVKAYTDAKKAYIENKTKRDNMWKTTLSQMNSDAVLKNVKSALGSDMYAAFITENKAFIDEYDALVKRWSTIGYNTHGLNELRQRIEELLGKANAYIKQHGYDGKTSGF